MLAREIAELCENYGIGLFSAPTATRTIYVGQLPANVAEGLLIIESASPPPHTYIDAEYPVLDFWAVSPHTDRAHATLEKVHSALHRKYNYNTANWHVSFSKSLGSIIDADRDNNGGKLYRLSVQFTCRNLNNIS